MKTNMKYHDVVRLAEHFKAIGQTEVRLDHDDDDLPWEHVTAVDDRGTQGGCQGAMADFKASHPCGLVFTWERNLTGHYTIPDVPGIERLPDRFAYKIMAILDENAVEHDEQASGHVEAAKALRAISAKLRAR